MAPRIFRLGSLIGTNCVERDVGKHWIGSYWLLTSSTARPCTLRTWGRRDGQLLFVAIGALREADRSKKVVGAAERCGAWEWRLFRIRHI